jgi:hypothetical protein
MEGSVTDLVYDDSISTLPGRAEEKTRKEGSRSPTRDLNPASPKYEAGGITSPPRFSLESDHLYKTCNEACGSALEADSFCV